jgi:hypothetical protein
LKVKYFFFSAWEIEEVEAFSHGCKNVFGRETSVFCVVERELSELGEDVGSAEGTVSGLQ